MVLYRGSSFQADMVDCYPTTQCYHKPERSCFVFMETADWTPKDRTNEKEGEKPWNAGQYEVWMKRR